MNPEIPIFQVFAYEVGPEDYGLSISVAEGIPADALRKIAREVADQLETTDIPEGDEVITKNL